MRPSVMRPLVFVAACALAGCSQPVPAPKEFKEYHAPDGTFQCEYPAGWVTEGGGGSRTDYSMVKFNKGDAEIRVEADLAGSLFADIGRNDGDAEPPVAKVHKLKIKRLDDQFTNYKEREAKPFSSKALGEGRKAVFVADGGIVGRIFGYHATLLTNDKRITIICQCSATDWKVLRPAFDRVIASFGR